MSGTIRETAGVVTFALRGEKAEQLLLFALDAPRPERPGQARLRAALRVEREQEQVRAVPIADC